MKLRADLSKEYGIVLEGGGAKGSYQIGAWKALREAGIRIRGIAGASVGSLNGALMCMDDLERAEYIWENITYSRVMDVDDELMEQVAKGNFREINFPALVSDFIKVVKDRGFDVAPLKNLIAETVDVEKILGSDRELYVITYSVSDKKKLVVDLKHIPEDEICDMLLASAYFLAFKNEKLKGKRYVDGAGLNNVPVDALIDRGYQDIIIIRIYGLGFDTEKVVKIPEDVNVYHIAPRQDLGGILEFDKKKARRNIKLGYFDAKRFLYGLEGKWYYIDAPGGDAYYFDKMMAEMTWVRPYIGELLEIPLEQLPELDVYRSFTEDLFPRLAKALKLKQDWTYKELYLAILEKQARKLHFNRFHIYTAGELAKKIHVKVRTLDSPLGL